MAATSQASLREVSVKLIIITFVSCILHQALCRHSLSSSLRPSKAGAIACPLYRLRKVETFARSQAARNTRMKPGRLKPKALASWQEK